MRPRLRVTAAVETLYDVLAVFCIALRVAHLEPPDPLRMVQRDMERCLSMDR